MTEISVSIISWNEEESIPLTIRSVRDFADEVVVLDNGSFDGTVETARETMDQLNLSGEVKVEPGLLMYESRYRAVEMCTGDWVMMLDANLVLRNRGDYGTRRIRQLVNRYRDKDLCMRFASINLFGDYRHVMRNQPVNPPHKLLFNARGGIKQATGTRHSRDRPIFLTGKLAKFKGVWGANLSRVRPAWRVWYRMRQSEWILDGNHDSIPEYVEATEGKTLEDVKNFAPGWYLNACRNQCVKIKDYFDEGLDILPETLREELEDPYFRIVYRDDEIAGRLPDVSPMEA